VIFLMAYLPGWGTRASSIARYESIALPCFLLLACWLATPRRQGLAWGLIGAQLVVQAYYAMLFSRGIWVG
jgi:hypothetical protein